MSEHTPTTSEVRTYYGLGRYEFNPDSCEHPSELHPEFDRWYAAELAVAERRGAIRALREAAEELDRIDPDRDAVYWTDKGYEFVHDWLNDRADREEAER